MSILNATAPLYNTRVSFTYDAAGNRTFRATIDEDKTIDESKVTLLTNSPFDNSHENSFDYNNIIVFPNPADNHIIIETNLISKSQVHCRIYDLNGRLIEKFEIIDLSHIVNLENYSAGTYIVKIYNNAQSLQYKIVKQ